MLILFENDFVDVIREKGYRDLLTLRSSSVEALKRFDPLSMSTFLEVPHHIYTNILHVSVEAMQIEYPYLKFDDVETFQRLTPAPVSYVYEWAINHGDEDLESVYAYCWAEEVEESRKALLYGEAELAGSPRFYPLFFIPNELVGAPTQFHLEIDEDDEEYDLGED
jgi:hypothetical protein